MDGRCDEAAAAQRDRDADVDVLAADELVALPDRVQLGHLAQRQRDGLHEQDAVEQALWNRPAQVLLGEPGDRVRLMSIVWPR